MTQRLIHLALRQNTLLPCVDSNRAGRYTPIRFVSTSDASRSALEYFSRGMAYGYSLGDCIATNEFNVTAADSRFSFDLDSSAFSVKVAVKKQSPERAVELARQLADGVRSLRQSLDRQTPQIRHRAHDLSHQKTIRSSSSPVSRAPVSTSLSVART